jgi:dipeptidyl aminopeptidase/acylaminoacyl peptidase
MAHRIKQWFRAALDYSALVSESRTRGGKVNLRSWILLFCVVGSASAQTGNYPAAKEGGNYMVNYYIPPAPSTTPWAPAWSPDGKYLAIAMQGSIWKIDPRTSVATELTYNQKYHSSPSWSPDGKWIVYTADEEGRSVQLEILNVETGESHALTSDRDIYLDPVFSPDGQKLAYVSTNPNGHFNIFVRDIRDGDWNGEEISLTSDHPYPRERLSVGRWDMHTQPAWTPDSKEIVFVSNRDVSLGSGDVWRMPVEPGGIAKAQIVLHEQTLFRTRPDVSMDGKRIVYSSTGGAAEQFTQLYILPLSGGAPYKLTFQSHDHFHPRWSPDGEWIAYISNENGLSQLHLLEVYGGADKAIVIQKREWKRPMGSLHVKVVDESTGRTVPARIQYLSPDGKFYAPFNAFARIGVEAGQYAFHTTGRFTAELPPGRMHLWAIKGFEYRPAEAEVNIAPNLTTEVVLRLRRIVNMAGRGWYSGSTHVHMNYGGNLLNTFPNLIMMSEAEDLNVANVMVANKDNRIMDWQYFVKGGGEHPISHNRSVKVVVGEEYRPPFWGHLFLIGLKDHLISPFTAGYEGTAIDSLYPSNTDVLRKALAQGALTGYVHPFVGDADPINNNLGEGRAFPVDAVLGTVQCIEWTFANHAELAVWHHALNNDLPIVPTGGEDSISDLQRTRFVGTSRTYAYVGKYFTTKTWLDAIRHGHTFFSTGPLLVFQVNGHLPGDTIHLPPSGGTVEVQGSVSSFAPLSKVVIYHNGKIFKELPTSGSFRERIHVSESGWYSLYAEGPHDLRIEAQYPQAATNAIRIYVGDQKIRNTESATYFVGWIEKLSAKAQEWPWWRSEAEKKHVLAQLEEARRMYEQMR